MARIIVTDPASDDQAAILLDLHAQAGMRTTIKYRTLFARHFDLLAEHPAIGAPRPGLGPRIRIGIVLPYIVIYEYDESTDTVTIFRIVHGRRNITAKLLTDVC
jgi:toxin ParE1/3/4